MAERKNLDEARQRAAMEAGGPPAPWPEPSAPVPPPEMAARQGSQAGGTEPSPRPVPFPEASHVAAPAAWTAPVPPAGAGPVPWPSPPQGVAPAERPVPLPEQPAPAGQAAPAPWPQLAAPTASPAPWPTPGQPAPSANGFPQTQMPGAADTTPAGAGDVLREFKDILRDVRQLLDAQKRQGGLPPVAGGTAPGRPDPFSTPLENHPTVPQVTQPTVRMWRKSS